MDLKNAEKLLRKINMLFESLQEDAEHVSAIERDLMRSHLRRLYDAFLEEAPTAAGANAKAKPRAKAQPKVEVIKQAPAARRPAPPPPAPAPTPEPAYEPPRLIELDDELQAIADTPPPPPPPKPQAKPRAAKPAPQPSAPAAAEPDEEVEALFALPKGSDMAAKLSSARISDLNRALGLNERYLTRDELFGGSDSALKDTLQTLNSFGSFEEAKQYLANTVIPKYDWTDKSKRKKAQVFIKLVSRRYK